LAKVAISFAFCVADEGYSVKVIEQENRELAQRRRKVEKTSQQVQLLLDDKSLELSNAKNYRTSMEDIGKERIFELNNLLGELQGQQSKIHRCKVMTNKLLKELNIQEQPVKQVLEKDLKLRACKEKYEV